MRPAAARRTQTLGLAALGARLRIGDWRVIFIEDVRSITVIGVGNRNETYDCEGSVMTERFKMTNKGEVAILVRTCRITWPPWSKIVQLASFGRKSLSGFLLRRFDAAKGLAVAALATRGPGLTAH